MRDEALKLKMEYIPRCCSGELSLRKTAAAVGITVQSVCRLKKRYMQYGPAIWIHGNTGRKPKNKRYDRNEITRFYNTKFPGAPFAVVADYCPLGASYSTVYNALTAAGIVSPRARIPVREKKKHLPRTERPNEGDMVQIDGCRHAWFIGKGKTCIHGGIDDATHKITALYMCENECLLGYYEILRRTAERFGGFPRAIYSDRSSCFFVTRNSDKMSLQEQLAGMRQKTTQWQSVAEKLNIELIAALSPEAKGRIERLWETLQGRLPYIFRFLGIDTISAANDFLKIFIDDFNLRFSVPAAENTPHWQPAPPLDYDFLMSVRAEKKTRADGSFVYHSYKFKLLAARAACVPFTLCLSERYGLRAYMGGSYYDVELTEPLCDIAGDGMPAVEKDLIYRYFYADTHSGRAVVQGAG